MTAPTPFNFRKLATLIASAGTLFWLYTFYHISNVPQKTAAAFNGLRCFR